jgi:hypothetical protein
MEITTLLKLYCATLSKTTPIYPPATCAMIPWMTLCGRENSQLILQRYLSDLPQVVKRAHLQNGLISKAAAL